MKNLSKFNVTYVDETECRHMGGWTNYCNFWEVTNEKGDVIAQINEQDGTAIVGGNYFQRNYRNTVIPIELLEVHDKYILIMVYNLHNTIKKLYYDYKPKPVSDLGLDLILTEEE